MKMKKHLKILSILLIMAFSIFNFTNRTLFSGANATYVEDPVTRDTIWTLVDSPFVVSNNITVYSNATLTIEPGVEVKFGGAFSLIISGKLYANGTNKHVVFTSNKEQPEVADWYAIIFNGIEKSTLLGCSISYATDGILVENGDVEIRNCTISRSQNGITAANSRLMVYDSTVNLCQEDGINITDSESTIQNSLIAENQGNGICISGDRQINIQENTIMANGNGVLLTGNESSNVNLSQNTISANTQAGIKIDANTHSGIMILNNIVSSNNQGFYISSSVSTYITNNSVSYNGIGMLYDEGSHVANYNDIYDNEMGMSVSDANVNAEYNYWGDPSGPHHELLNPYGKGNPVGGNGINLDFIFFLAKPIGRINTRPTAVLLTDKILVSPSENVMLFATNSFDTDGRVDRYFFDFGDGSNSGWTTLSILTHKYSLGGQPVRTYNATLTVMDDYGTTSDDVLTTITVRNLMPLQVNVNLNSSRVHEGEQISITVYVTDGSVSAENATVTMFSVKNGNFTETSGLTDANGQFVTTFIAPDVINLANIRIVARASKTGYADGSDYEYLEVSPFLSVQITVTPSIIKSEETANVLVQVKSNEETVGNASVTILSSGGQLSSGTGTTDLSGTFSLVFTAPQTVTFLNVTITATATKDGYMNGAEEKVIAVEPKILSVQITANTNTTISEATLNLTVHVEYEGMPVEGANVTLTTENGSFSITTKLTDNYGNVTSVFTAPPVSNQSLIIITAHASKAAYADGQGQLEITDDPRTFSIQISAPTVISGESANFTVSVTCREDSTSVAGATVTISSTYGDFTIMTQTTDQTGTCTFNFNAPETTTDLLVIITVNATKNGYIDAGSQTTITISPETTTSGGWSLITILLILIPIIIAVIVVILIKMKIIVISSEEEER
jgi:parallel beta-helix repeat protein